jgi:hypothetical protein
MRITLGFVLAGLVACGGGTAESPKGNATGSAGSAASYSPGDVSIDVGTIDLKGVIFEPAALGAPGMPLVEAKRKTTLDKQKAVFQTTKDPVQKEAQAAVLATMLYKKSKDASATDKQSLLTDARQALRDAAQVSGDKVDEVTLRMLGSYELMLGDLPAAEKAWGGLVAKAPKDKDLLTNKAWWAYTLLLQDKNGDALNVVKDETISEKLPELAYVTAWARWRGGDESGAWQAIVTALKGWGENAGRDALDRDVLLFAGRTPTTLADAVATLVPIYGKSNEQQYSLFVKLGLQAYKFAGRWADGVAIIDKAIAVAGDKVPANDRPALRFMQADYTIQLDDPVAAAAFAKQALDALPACGAKCPDKDKENLVESVYIFGRIFHLMYANAHDDRYYEPADQLYSLAIPLLSMNDKLRTEATAAKTALEQTFKGMKHDAGKHDKDSIGAILKRHDQEIQACYEQALSANPKLAGNLVVMLEADTTGVVKGASTEPKAGMADMSAVATCAQAAAKNWKLPKVINGTGTAHSTRIKLTYALTPGARNSAK